MDQTGKREVMVSVGHNPLLCDCNLYDLLRYLYDDMDMNVYNYIIIKVENLKCLYPNGMEGPELNQLHYTTYKCPEHEYFGIVENCQFGCTCSIRPYDKTRILDCSNRNMSVFLIDMAKVNFVGRYPLILNLTGNVLTEIPSIENLKKINIIGLLLSNNNISQITLEKLPRSLKVLELHNNNISKFDVHVMDYLISSSFNEFTLSGNPLKCDCANEDLLEFVQLKRSHYKDLDELKCKNMDLPVYNMTIEQFCPSISPLELNYRVELNETNTELSADF
ncbi:hypothetical protein M0804_015606 [Polistes exclamans]|nr:hypothetical protein M0804_015606 [Polistes exclamans]